MRAGHQQTSRQEPELSGIIGSSFQLIMRSAVAVNVCMLLISLGLAYLLVSIVVEGPLTTMAKEHTRHRVEVMVTAIEALVPPGTVFGPQIDQKIQEPIKSLIRQGKQHGDSPYFILFRIDGTVVAQGIEPENPDTNRLHQRDVDGIPYIQLLIEAAKRGGGFVQYKWNKPDGKGPVQKIAYAKMLTGGAWWIASGVYLDDVAKVRDEILYEQGFYLSVLAAVLFFLLSVGYRVGNNMGHEIAQPVVERMRKLARTGDEERRLLAGTLHNLVGRLIVPLKHSLYKLKHSEDTSARETIVKDASTLIDQFDEECQSVEHEIFPLAIQRHGVGTALKYWAKKELPKYPTPPEVEFAIDDSVGQSDTERERALYLVAQGLVLNVLKSAQATQVRIGLACQGESVMLTVEDNGRGFDVETVVQQASSPKSRYGIPWMLAQVEVYSGRITFDSSPENGTTVRVTMSWPLETEIKS